MPQPETQYFTSKYQSSISKRLLSNIETGSTNVSIVQGFPGTGKSHIIKQALRNSKKHPIHIQYDTESSFSLSEFIMDIESKLFPQSNNSGLLSSKTNGRYLTNSVCSKLAHEEFVLIIDQFQNLINPKQNLPPKPLQELISHFSLHPKTKSHIIIITDQKVSIKRWNEHCAFIEVEGFPLEERSSYFNQLLSSQNADDLVPKNRIHEISNRLAGNPRAMKTVVSCLHYNSIEDILSNAPEEFKPGDVHINLKTLPDFERDILNRTIPQLPDAERTLLDNYSVFRAPFYSEDYNNPTLPDSVQTTKNSLVNRYFISRSTTGLIVHPIVREICIFRLKKSTRPWQKSHAVAADYYLSKFKLSKKSSTHRIASSYSELRHHLIESKRSSELSSISSKYTLFAISQIEPTKTSQVPSNREILEERIALLSSIPEDQLQKRLQYHLALCLKSRGLDGDYVKALRHIRKATHPGIYYAAWLLRLELEEAVSGWESMLSSFCEAAKHLSNNNNVSEVYRKCAELLAKNNKTEKAVKVLEKGIPASGPHCFTSIAPLCAKYLEELNRIPEAIKLLKAGLENPKITRPAPIYTQCARLLSKSGRTNDAIILLDTAIKKANFSKLDTVYASLAQLHIENGSKELAITTLRKGIDKLSENSSVKLRTLLSSILVEEGNPSEAIDILTATIQANRGRSSSGAIINYSKTVQSTGNLTPGAQSLESIKGNIQSKDKEIFYKELHTLFFRDHNLNDALRVNKAALSETSISDKCMFYKNTADLLFRIGQQTQAFEIYQRGVSDPNCGSTYVLYKDGAKMLSKAGMTERGIEFLQEGISEPSTKDKAALYQEAAKMLKKSQMYEEAVELLTKATLEPGLNGRTRIFQSLADVLHETKHTEKAISVLKDSIDQIPTGNLSQIYIQISKLLEAIGRESEAYFYLSEAEDKFPTSNNVIIEIKRFRANYDIDNLKNSLGSTPNDTTFDETARKLRFFKQKIENEDVYKNFYNNLGEVTADEKYVHYQFKLVWEDSPSKVNAEVDNGRGAVDFQITRGNEDTTLVEFKLGGSSSLKRNLENQIPIYAAANQTNKYFTAIVNFTESDQKSVKRTLDKLGKIDLDRIIIIDARKDNKPSASVAKDHSQAT